MLRHICEHAHTHTRTHTHARIQNTHARTGSAGALSLSASVTKYQPVMLSVGLQRHPLHVSRKIIDITIDAFWRENVA
jgi:hypothetical protein